MLKGLKNLGKKLKDMNKAKKFGAFTGVVTFFLLLFGIAGATFAALGTCIFCVLPVLTFLLSIFGLSLGTILDHNQYFLIGGFTFLIATVILLAHKQKNCKVCKVDVKK